MFTKSFCGKYYHSNWWQQIGIDPATFQGVKDDPPIVYTLVFLEKEAILNVRTADTLNTIELSIKDAKKVLSGKIQTYDSSEQISGGKYNA